MEHPVGDSIPFIYVKVIDDSFGLISIVPGPWGD